MVSAMQIHSRLVPVFPAVLLGAAIFLGPMASTTLAQAKDDTPHQIAVAYLKALEGDADQTARGYLLGGIPLAAQTYQIPNWNIVEREPVRREQADIAEVKARMKRLDERGRKALTEVMRIKSIQATDVDRKRAKELLGLTRKEAQTLQKDFPVFAYVARVGKDVFWHPKNPWRQVIKHVGKKGKYTLEMHLFRIEEREAHRPPRVWPLRVLRLQTDKGYDSGWKVLPASDWDPDY